MRFFIDTEFDRAGLISIAIVSEFGDNFYEVLQNETGNQWVRENVIPKLHKEAIHIIAAKMALSEYLSGYDNPTFIADHPADIQYFCGLLITDPSEGTRIGGNMTFELWDSPQYPDDPMRHNALRDAEMLREMYMKEKG